MNDAKQPLGTAHSNTLLIVERLKEANDQDVIPYGELSDLIAMDVQADGGGYLRTARQILLRDCGRYFGVVRGLGVMACNAQQTNAIGTGFRKRIRRMSRRAQTVLIKGVKYDDLSDTEKTEHNASLSIYGALVHFSKDSTAAKVTEIVQKQDNTRLSIDMTLAALRGDK